VLLFQDLAAIPMLAAIPLLAPAAADSGLPAWLAALRAATVVAAVVAGSRFVACPLLRFVASLRNPEILTATGLLLVVATALLVSLAGLSMALGAFLAGVLLAPSELRHELEADIAPFMGLLLGLFFVSVGLAIDLGVVLERPAAVAGLVSGIVVLKALVAWGIGRFAVGRGDAAASFGLLLSQGGEFAFVLFAVATRDGAMDGRTSALLVLVVALSMATTPPLYALHDRLVRPRLRRAATREQFVPPEEDPLVVIAGFGRVGQVVGRVLRAKRIAFTALDVSPEHIEFIRRFGNRVFYGDASRLELLRAARADRARVFVLAIDDVEASIRAAKVVLAHFPNLTVFARARNRQHAFRLRRLGVTRIVRETLASSLEITAGVLEEMGLDVGDARAAVERFRRHDEELFEEAWRDQDDLQKLTDVAHRGREDLERLFEEDAARRRSA
jgi:glutathione-regulated potassium-efflux system protein KefB